MSVQLTPAQLNVLGALFVQDGQTKAELAHDPSLSYLTPTDLGRCLSMLYKHELVREDYDVWFLTELAAEEYSNLLRHEKEDDDAG